MKTRRILREKADCKQSISELKYDYDDKIKGGELE